MDKEESNKAIEILEERIEELESQNRDLEYKLEEFEKFGFEELIRKATNFDGLKKQTTAFRNKLLSFEDEVDEVIEKNDNVSVMKLIRDVVAKGEKGEEEER